MFSMMIAATTMMEKIATWMSIAASDAMVKATLPVHPPSHQMFTALPPVATELSRTFVALTSSLVLSSTLTRSSTKLSSRSTKPRSSLVSLSLYGEYTCGRDTTRSKEGGRTTTLWRGKAEAGNGDRPGRATSHSGSTVCRQCIRRTSAGGPSLCSSVPRWCRPARAARASPPRAPACHRASRTLSTCRGTCPSSCRSSADQVRVGLGSVPGQGYAG